MTDGLHLVVRFDGGGTALISAHGRLTAAAVDELVRVALRTRALADVPMVVDLAEVEADADAVTSLTQRCGEVPGAPVRVRPPAERPARLRPGVAPATS